MKAKHKITWAPEDFDIVVAIPTLGVEVTIDGVALAALARRAHDNRGGRAKSGAADARRVGVRPVAFQNRFAVRYETEHGRGVSVKDKFYDEALARYEADIRSGRYICVELWGPETPQDRQIVCLKRHGTPRKESAA